MGSFRGRGPFGKVPIKGSVAGSNRLANGSAVLQVDAADSLDTESDDPAAEGATFLLLQEPSTSLKHKFWLISVTVGQHPCSLSGADNGKSMMELRHHSCPYAFLEFKLPLSVHLGTSMWFCSSWLLEHGCSALFYSRNKVSSRCHCLGQA